MYNFFDEFYNLSSFDNSLFSRQPLSYWEVVGDNNRNGIFVRLGFLTKRGERGALVPPLFLGHVVNAQFIAVAQIRKHSQFLFIIAENRIRYNAVGACVACAALRLCKTSRLYEFQRAVAV